MIDLSPEALMLVEFAALLVIKAVVAVVYAVPGAAPFVAAVTSIIKRVPFLGGVAAPTIAFAVAVIVWLASIAAAHFGYTEMFTNGLATLTTIIAGFAGLAVTTKRARVNYEQAKSLNVPLFGHARTEG